MIRIFFILLFYLIPCCIYSQHNVSIEAYTNKDGIHKIWVYSPNDVDYIRLDNTKSKHLITLWKNGNKVGTHTLYKLFFNLKIIPKTSDVIDITNHSFTASVSPESDQYDKKTNTYTEINHKVQVGICYSIDNEEPTLTDNVTPCKSGEIYDVQEIEVEGLLPKKKYYYRGFCKLNDEVFYGDTHYTTTLEEDKNFGDMFVDLGLPSGLLWATYNLGASKPEELGNLYAWGETETKDSTEFDWEHYKFRDPNNTSSLTKYYYKDKIRTLEAEDDAVRFNYGGTCKMPTHTDFEELIDHCKWTWFEDSQGTKGYFVTGPNKNKIFFPFKVLHDTYHGLVAGYWTNELEYGIGDYKAQTFLISKNTIFNGYNIHRELGNFIRPVMINRK